jgi:hypothetical protein
MAGYGTYATIADLKGVLGITSTTDDTMMRKQLESASRSIDSYCNRRFFVTSETKYFDGARTLWLPDLLSITTLKTDEDGNATFENTLATTDYIKYGGGLEDSLNTLPTTRLEISHDSNYGSFASGVKKGVEIIGSWGYGDGISTTPYTDSGTTTDGTLTVGATAVAVHSVTPHSAGQTILVESEQTYVESIATTVLTVVRGVNGTTKATHADNIATYIYQYPADVRQACIDLGVALYQNRAKQGLQSERLGDYSYTIAGTSLGKGVIESMLDNSIRGYKRMRF